MSSAKLKNPGSGGEPGESGLTDTEMVVWLMVNSANEEEFRKCFEMIINKKVTNGKNKSNVSQWEHEEEKEDGKRPYYTTTTDYYTTTTTTTTICCCYYYYYYDNDDDDDDADDDDDDAAAAADDDDDDYDYDDD